jgi:uncharacterized caspase-like protein
MPSSRRLGFVHAGVPALLLCAALLFSLSAAPAMAAGRTALVIGNSAYPTAPLRNPVNDAADMAAALKRLGFDVTLLTDATMRQMEEAVRAFGLKLRGGGIGLFYFAGHGVQVAGENYLVPVNAAIQSEGDVKYGSLNAGLVLAKMEDAGNGPNVVILDACRNNPFARSFRSAEAGLARMDAPTGSIIAYATAPGHVASDGEGRNGLYTQHLLRNIATQGLSISDMFMNVREGVVRDSGKKQVPWENTSLIGRFSLAGAPASAVPVQAAAPAQPAPAASSAPAPVTVSPATAPRPTAEEARLLDAMRDAWSMKHETERQLVARLAKPLAAKGSIYGRYALDWLSEDFTVRGKAMRNAAQQGVPLAMAHYAESLMYGKLAAADGAEARAWAQKALSLGEPKARIALGFLLVRGLGGPADVAGGERLLAQAARERVGDNLRVGTLYWSFIGTALPKAQADATGLDYIRRGALLGDTHAMIEMGLAYEFGKHTAKNVGEMFRWFGMVAEKGDAYGMTVLGQHYQRDWDGHPKDDVSAAKWFRKAAEKGDRAGVILYAGVRISGQGVRQDVKAGLATLQALADRGDGWAQSSLGHLYYEGVNVPKDKALAYFWFKVAANADDIEGNVWSEELAKELSPAELEKVDARAAKWKPKAK